MIKKISFLTIGIIIGIIAIFHNFVITSDIPIEYTVNEAIQGHILLFISTFFIIIGSIQFEKKLTKSIFFIFFLILAIVNWSIFKSHANADYFDSSYAQLSISYMLHSALISLINGYLLIKNRS
jgi:hypothetical protein